jgi:predicted Zn-dependent protease with MMP-like domain
MRDPNLTPAASAKPAKKEGGRRFGNRIVIIHLEWVIVPGMKPTWEQMCRVAEGEIARIRAELPEPLRERAGQVPVALERRPSAEMEADGVEADTLGLFTGPDWASAGEVPQPPHIILYLDNLWEVSETDAKRFGDEMATTYLHELGHFFGFDETGLGELGLE